MRTNERLLRWAIACVLLATLAPLPRPHAQAPAFHAPRGALRSLHAALRRGHARLAFYGASHTAADGYTHTIRTRLQARFGDGGPGLVSVAVPFPFHRQSTVRTARSTLVGTRIFGRDRRRDDYGPAGFFLEAPAAAEARIDTAEGVRFSRAKLLFRGAAPTMRIDGANADVRDWVEVADGPHRVELEVPAGTRIDGLVLERERGVVVDALGVPGARAADQELWRTRTLDTTLHERPLDLFALAYGTNESANARPPLETYREKLRATIAAWKRRAPRASCLLVGPGDWPTRRRDRSFGPRPRLQALVEAQREEARAAGCAFFDTFAFMGGEGSMVRWVAEGLGDSDHVHFTPEGHERVGAAIADALIAGVSP
ncbi:MAG: hypothetical protein H6721_08665 [Sandaracinus sp.]|nr:hypothetical protein [Sandaracinus sp.]MCB9632189.1 hypothetical protein [Sandaracinus sp.]